MDSWRSILADAQPPEVVQPRQRPFDVPAILPQAAVVGRPPPGDARPDAAPAQLAAMRVGVEAPVAVEAPRPTPWPTGLAAYRRDGIDQRDHRLDIGDI